MKHPDQRTHNAPDAMYGKLTLNSYSQFCYTTITLLMGSFATGYAVANSAGLQGFDVIAGSVDKAVNGLTTTITAHSQNSIVNWSKFDVNVGEKVQFNLPTADSKMLNRVVSTNYSTIAGVIGVNQGKVYLVNPNGVIFSGEQSYSTFDAGLFVLSSIDLDPTEFLQGKIVALGQNGTKIPVSNVSVGPTRGLFTLSKDGVINFHDLSEKVKVDASSTTPTVLDDLQDFKKSLNSSSEGVLQGSLFEEVTLRNNADDACSRHPRLCEITGSAADLEGEELDDVGPVPDLFPEENEEPEVVPTPKPEPVVPPTQEETPAPVPTPDQNTGNADNNQGSDTVNPAPVPDTSTNTDEDEEEIKVPVGGNGSTSTPEKAPDNSGDSSKDEGEIDSKPSGVPGSDLTPPSQIPESNNGGATNPVIPTEPVEPPVIDQPEIPTEPVVPVPTREPAPQPQPQPPVVDTVPEVPSTPVVDEEKAVLKVKEDAVLLASEQTISLLDEANSNTIFKITAGNNDVELVKLADGQSSNTNFSDLVAAINGTNGDASNLVFSDDDQYMASSDEDGESEGNSYDPNAKKKKKGQGQGLANATEIDGKTVQKATEEEVSKVSQDISSSINNYLNGQAIVRPQITDQVPEVILKLRDRARKARSVETTPVDPATTSNGDFGAAITPSSSN